MNSSWSSPWAISSTSPVSHPVSRDASVPHWDEASGLNQKVACTYTIRFLMCFQRLSFRVRLTSAASQRFKRDLLSRARLMLLNMEIAYQAVLL